MVGRTTTTARLFVGATVAEQPAPVQPLAGRALAGRALAGRALAGRALAKANRLWSVDGGSFF